MAHHIELVTNVITAIDKVHQDTSVEADVTRESLIEIRDHVELLIDVVQTDLNGD